MTDEREAQIRQLHSGIRNHPDIRFLLRLLDEARAEIARLRVPAEADVMERAGGVFDEVVALLFDGTRPKPYLRPDAIIPIARALGEQRARIEAKVKGASPSSEVLSVVELLHPWEGQMVTFRNIKDLRQQVTAYGDQRAREARDAALDEAAQLIETKCHLDGPASLALDIAATRIRALAAAPPQSEGGDQ